MDPTTELTSLPLTALVKRAEDVRLGRLDGRAVRLVSHDALARLATLRSLYQRLVEHPALGGAWPWSLPAGALAPALPPSTFPGIPPRMFWFGLCAGGEPAAEAVQLCEQLEQLRRFPDLPEWVERAASTSFPAAILGQGHPVDRRGSAFGFLGGERTDAPAALATAVRTLHHLLGRPPLLADGGLLELDAAAPGVRGLVAAGWLERLAHDGLVVVAVDEAHLAGPFVTELVRTLLDGTARVLVVLAGEPAAGGEATQELAGPLGAFGRESAQPLSLPAGDAGYLAAALAAISPSGLFAEEHVLVVAEAIGVADDAVALYEELVAGGWLRPVTRHVSAFGSARRHAAAAEQVTGMLGDELAARGAALCRDAATRADDPLGLLLGSGARAAVEGPASEAAWEHARRLARAGEIERAAAVGALVAAPSPTRRAVLAGWRRAAGEVDGAAAPGRRLADAEPEADGRAEAERRIVLAARLAATDPGLSGGHLVAALTALATATGPTDDDGRLRAAAARVFLAAGQIEGLAHALGPDAPTWLPPVVVKRLVELHAQRQSPVLVAREVDLALARHAVDTLADLAPASRAVALARLALVERLESGDRLAAAGDEATVAVAAARAVLNDERAAVPVDRWRARRWEAVVAHRRGDAAGAVTMLGTLAEEQCAVVRADHRAVIDTTVWLARLLLESNRLDEAAAAVQRARRALEATGVAADDPLHLDADLVWAGVLGARGRHAEAVDVATRVVTALAAGVSPHDDTLLRARFVLGGALARLGRAADALGQFDEVVGRRAVADRPEGRRLVTARHERAGCLVLLHRYAEALVELDAVVTQRTQVAPASDPVLVAMRCDRAQCLLMLQRWHDALGDLDPALAVLHARLAPDDERLLVARQQRAMCLHALRRSTEALAEFDGILAATATWPRDHAFIATIQRLRTDVAALVPLPAPTGPIVATLPAPR